MANDVQLICWPTPDRPAIKIQIQSRAGHIHHPTGELVQLDTGYSGEILIPATLFETLNLGEHRMLRQLRPIGLTVTGEAIHFLEAWAEVNILQTNERHRLIVQTFANNTRFLIGRAFLRRFKIVLDGPGGLTCLMQPANT